MRNSSSTRVSPLMTAKWIYLHNFLTFTDEKYSRDMSVMYWRKQNVSNALNSTNIFAVCHAGSIWSMIDIKGCLRISVNKLVRLCKLTLSFITTLAPIDLLGYFKSDFFPQVSVVSNQIKSLLLSHHHSTSALVSEILTSVLQTVQKNKTQQFTYGQYIFTDCTEDNVQNTHTYTQYTQCTIKTYLITNTHYTPYVHVCIMYTSIHSIMWRCNRL